MSESLVLSGFSDTITKHTQVDMLNELQVSWKWKEAAAYCTRIIEVTVRTHHSWVALSWRVTGWAGPITSLRSLRLVRGTDLIKILCHHTAQIGEPLPIFRHSFVWLEQLPESSLWNCWQCWRESSLAEIWGGVRERKEGAGPVGMPNIS